MPRRLLRARDGLLPRWLLLACLWRLRSILALLSQVEVLLLLLVVLLRLLQVLPLLLFVFVLLVLVLQILLGLPVVLRGRWVGPALRGLPRVQRIVRGGWAERAVGGGGISVPACRAAWCLSVPFAAWCAA